MKRQRRSFSAEFKHKAACLVAVRGQGRFWRRERSSCKAGFGEMARTYILYVSVSSRIPTPQMRAQQPKKSPAIAGLSYFLNRCEARIVSGVASEARARHF